MLLIRFPTALSMDLSNCCSTFWPRVGYCWSGCCCIFDFYCCCCYCWVWFADCIVTCGFSCWLLFWVVRVFCYCSYYYCYYCCCCYYCYYCYYCYCWVGYYNGYCCWLVLLFFGVKSPNKELILIIKFKLNLKYYLKLFLIIIINKNKITCWFRSFILVSTGRKPNCCY